MSFSIPFSSLLSMEHFLEVFLWDMFNCNFNVTTDIIDFLLFFEIEHWPYEYFSFDLELV